MRSLAVLVIGALSCRRTPTETRVAPEPPYETKPLVASGSTIDEIDATPLSAPTPLPASPVIVGGPRHTCVLDTDGKASCFGNNANGALGDGTTTSHPLDPVRVKLDELAQISAGDDFTCALRRDRSVWCWGTGVWSIFPGNAPHPVPTRIEGLPPARMLQASWGAACVSTEKDVYCWGRSKFGQGDAPVVELGSTPRAMGTGEVRALGHQHVDGAPVLRSDDSIEVALASGAHELLSSRTSRGSQMRVFALRGRPFDLWTVLADGSVHREFVLDLETHQPADRGKIAHRVMALPPVRSLARAMSPTCAVVTDGRVFCWGHNSSGELGDGTTTPRDEPVAVTGVSEGVAVMAALGHACAITARREIWCWGKGYDGGAPGAQRESKLPERVASF